MSKPTWAKGTKRQRHLKVATDTASVTATASVSETGTRKHALAGKPLAPRQRARARAEAGLPDVAWQEPYLAALIANGGQVVKAAIEAKVSRWSIARRRQTHPEFERAELDAMKFCFETCESEAKRRALDGVESSWTSIDKDGTRHVHKETKFSDTILLRLLVKLESGSWNEKRVIEHALGITFKTQAERKEALEKARAAMQQQRPVTAIHGRS